MEMLDGEMLDGTLDRDFALGLSTGMLETLEREMMHRQGSVGWGGVARRQIEMSDGETLDGAVGWRH